jgi:hypothetical protein
VQKPQILAATQRRTEGRRERNIGKGKYKRERAEKTEKSSAVFFGFAAYAKKTGGTLASLK